MIRSGWALEAEPWEHLSEALAGRPWKRTYLERIYAQSVTTDSGVYVICASLQHLRVTGRLMDHLYSAVYVGQALDLRQRFGQHVAGYREVRQALRTFRRLDFWYAQVDRCELDECEQSLIDAIGPSVNSINVRVRVGRPIPAGSVATTRRIQS